MVHVGLVNLPQVVLLHDLNEYGKGLLFRNVLDEQEAADESAALAVADFGIVDRIGLGTQRKADKSSASSQLSRLDGGTTTHLHHVEQALLATLVAKELVVGISAVDVASNDLLARRLLLDVVPELLLGVGEIGAAQVLPSERPQIEWNALSNVLFELGGLLFGPRVPVGDDLVPKLPADLLHFGDCNKTIHHAVDIPIPFLQTKSLTNNHLHEAKQLRSSSGRLVPKTNANCFRDCLWNRSRCWN